MNGYRWIKCMHEQKKKKHQKLLQNTRTQIKHMQDTNTGKECGREGGWEDGWVGERERERERETALSLRSAHPAKVPPSIVQHSSATQLHHGYLSYEKYGSF